jgi:hypothetical protein
MKTPRDILLARHRTVEAKLDDVRQAALDDLRRHKMPPTPRPSFFTQLANLFRLPKPALAGLALVWSIIILLNVIAPDGSSSNKTTPAQMVQRPTVISEELRAQRRLFAELVGTSKDVEALPPRFVPRPRGEAIPAYIYV